MILNSRHFMRDLSTDWAKDIPMCVERKAMQQRLYDEWVAEGSPNTLGAPPPPLGDNDCTPGKILFETDAYVLVVTDQGDETGEDVIVLLAFGDMPQDISVRIDDCIVFFEWSSIVDGHYHTKPLVKPLTGRERSIQRLESLGIGDVVCDMHDGWSGLPILVEKHFVVRCDDSSEVLDTLLRSIQKNPAMPHNKEAVVIGENVHGDGLQAAYSYDGHKFGMFEFVINKYPPGLDA